MLNNQSTFSLLLGLLLVTGFGCKEDKPQQQAAPPTTARSAPKVPAFKADSAYAFIERQIAFGPRVPNTPEHAATRDWMVATLEGYGMTVQQQNFTDEDYYGNTVNGTNVIGRYRPELTNRILLAAHWDTRQIADSPLADDAREQEPIPGADDGGSGVGVLLEIARVLQANPVDMGIDIVFFDAEDQGEPYEVQSDKLDQIWWCLGSQYWSANPHSTNFKYGILLDMVGARNARFAKEEISRRYAPQVVDRIWKLARQMGKGNYFADQNVGPITDDHLFVNRVAGIPMVDIINTQPGGKTSFGNHWHTHNDDISIIDKRTLQAVGQVVTALIYREAAGNI